MTTKPVSGSTIAGRARPGPRARHSVHSASSHTGNAYHGRMLQVIQQCRRARRAAGRSNTRGFRSTATTRTASAPAVRAGAARSRATARPRRRPPRAPRRSRGCASRGQAPASSSATAPSTTGASSPLARNPMPTPVPIQKPPSRGPPQREREPVVGHGETGEQRDVGEEQVGADDEAEAAEQQQRRDRAVAHAVELAPGDGHEREGGRHPEPRSRAARRRAAAGRTRTAWPNAAAVRWNSGGLSRNGSPASVGTTHEPPRRSS